MRSGNAQIWGIIGEQKEAAFAAKRVILTAEEIVDEAVIRSDPNRTLIPEFIVDAVCTCRTARTPPIPRVITTATTSSTCSGTRSARRDEGVQAYLDEWVYGVPDRADYLEKLGAETLARLQVPPRFSEPVNYGEY